jgi:hypothetical protein
MPITVAVAIRSRRYSRITGFLQVLLVKFARSDRPADYSWPEDHIPKASRSRALGMTGMSSDPGNIRLHNSASTSR